MTKNHFEVLGLKPGVLEDEIKKTYRALAKKWHPDKNKEAGAEEKFKEISVSYEYLISKDRREMLERDLKKKSETTTTGAYKFWSHNDFGYTSGTSGKHDTKASSSHNTKSDTKTKTESKENTKPSKTKTHWSDSFTSKNKNKSKTKPSKPMYDEPFVEDLYDDDDDDFQYGYTDQEFYSRPKPRGNPNFSFAFKSFVDHLDSEFNTLFPDTNGSYNRFGHTGLSFLNAGQPPPKPRKREVAPENGFIDGLDEEYLFTPRQSKPENFEGATTGTYKCNFCQKYFTPSKLIEHEIKCGKWLNDDEEEDYDIDYSQAYPAYNTTRKPHADWQEARNELQEQIKQAKKMAKMKAFHEKESVTCKFCGIGLSKNVADRHILFCERKHKFKTSEGRSKTERAKQYARDIPEYGYSSRGDDGEGYTESRAKQSHSTREKMGKAQSMSDMPQRPKSSSSQSKRPSSGLGVNGEKVGSKKPGTGCSSCSQKYGTNAKFYCSCGTKRSTFT